MDNDITIDDTTIDLTLLANFTHQVINPLNGVAGTLDNLIDGTVSENRRAQRTRVARAQLEAVITLIRNLAYLSSADYEKSNKEKIIVLSQVIIEAAMYYQEHGAIKQISIDLTNKEDQNRVPGEPDVLRQILMNLFDNAVKYSKDGSIVQIKHWIQKHTKNAMISVRSAPNSMPIAEDIEKLFTLGFRGQNARSIVASGTGLGLYICRHLMETRLLGTISVQREGDTLLFTLKIPNGETE